MNQTVNPGDVVVDATVGNGHDTTYLAKLVGPTGHVYGFDVQDAAIAATQAALTADKLDHQVTLTKTGHENLNHVLPAGTAVKCAIFNLGYLPGGDKTVITTAPTTLTAVEALEDRLATNGLIILMVYTGHPGGQDEADALSQHVNELDQHQFQVLRYGFINQIHTPPYLIAIQKR
ncbi:SAM-dependent methyltransferase [Lactiplantibacillus garii]|uniref:SAM-dependent methyltransferase n=1 Tax=Lactiplantibacillus garii TaxID=2306423 RepID=A0A426D5D4_9LACO|nr:class I SAM-dependent methyltransferase [Lactiplantibacillus garii]RRK09804.1 SAM-dependent methyltransferase [Lactiplantibacillus garii]